jgi:hypothetical protein
MTSILVCMIMSRIIFLYNFENVPYKILFSRCQIRVQESARMQDFVPFTPELRGAFSGPQPYSNCTPSCGGLHTRSRNLGALLATY